MRQELLHEFQLGDVTVRPLTGTFIGPKGSQHVSPRSMEVFLCLCESAGEIVEHDEIRLHVWGEKCPGSSAISHCVSELRHALDDHRKDPRYIQTITNRGYRLVIEPHTTRFIATQNQTTIDSPQENSHTTPNGTTPTVAGGLQSFIGELKTRNVFRVAVVYLIGAWLTIQVIEATFSALLIPEWVNTTSIIILLVGFPIAIILAWIFELTPHGIELDHSREPIQSGATRRFIDLVLISAIVLTIGLSSYYLIRYVGDRQAEVKLNAATPNLPQFASAFPIPDSSIAVLPFTNLSNDKANEYFSDGLAEDILNLLAKFKELKVASRTSTFYFKNKDVDIRTIAQRLGVRHVLEGSFRRQGDKVRITAQLTDAETGFNFWSEQYDRRLEDIFKIQDDISKQVVKKLKVLLSVESGEYLQRRATLSVDAYDQYLQGLGKLRGPKSQTSLSEAETFFQTALQIDPAYAEAFAGICEVYLEQYAYSRTTEDFEQAQESCQRALTLETSALPVYLALGNLYLESGQYAEAENEFESAAKLNSNSVDAYLGLADIYYKQGRLHEAEFNYQRVLELQPQFWRGHQQMGNFLFATGRSAEAIKYYQYLTELTPDNDLAFNSLGAAYFMLGKFDDAVTAWKVSARLQPGHENYSNLGSSLFFSGRYIEAVAMYQKSIDLAPDDYLLWGHLGDAYTAVNGAQEKAQEAYGNAISRAQLRLTVNKTDAEAIAALGHYYARKGERNLALDALSRAIELAPENMYINYDSAVAWTTLGEHPQALVAIEKAVALGYPSQLLASDAGLRELNRYERFLALAPGAKQEK